jgi:hypothetical protein
MPLGEGMPTLIYFFDELGWLSFFSPFFLPAIFLPKS